MNDSAVDVSRTHLGSGGSVASSGSLVTGGSLKSQEVSRWVNISRIHADAQKGRLACGGCLKSYLTSGLAGGSGQSRGSHGSRGSALTTGTASALLSGLSLCRTQSRWIRILELFLGALKWGVSALLQIVQTDSFCDT